MSRPTPPERLDNPIRQLRFELAPPGRNALSQAELAPLVDIPLDSLKGLESGRITFSPLMQNRIKLETCAVWNTEDRRWRFGTPKGPLYHREDYLQYRLLIDMSQQLWLHHDAFFAFWRIKLLLETLEPKAQFKFVFRLNAFLEENRQEFCPERFAEFFKDASGFIELLPELDRSHPTHARRTYAKRLLRHLKIDDETWERFKVGFDLEGYEKALKRPRKPKKSE